MEGFIVWIVVMLLLRALSGAFTQGSGGKPTGPGGSGTRPGPRQRHDAWEQIRQEWQRQMEAARGHSPARTAPSPPLEGAARTSRPGTYAVREASRQTGREDRYRGSMDHVSGEGESLMYGESDPETQSSFWQDDDGEGAVVYDANSAAAGAGPIPVALRALASGDGAGAQGAGAAVVLAEILGPPRARAVRRPTSPASRWR